MEKMSFEKAFTHGGKFHADDVFGAALLRLINPEIRIERGFLVPADYDGIVFDIGMGKFDHHQVDKRVREDGVAYAAFGLLFEEFGYLLVKDEKDRMKFDREFIEAMDQADNCGTCNNLSKAIAAMNPCWDEVDEKNEAFFEAVEMAQVILVHQFKQIEHKAKAEKQVKEAIKKSNRGGYNIQAVSETNDRTKLKKPFPGGWRGKNEKEIEKITGIKGVRFCHTSGFLTVTNTLEAALKVTRYMRDEVILI
ncbi:MAG: MYG1 family protein [Eubacterium sp.]|nr:MYG1 family protein [Eubacterium sp.]